MSTIQRTAVFGLLFALILTQTHARGAVTAEAVGKLQEDVLAICATRNAKLQALAAEYKANDAKESARAFKITMPLGMVRRPMHFEMRRWGGKWLPGVSIMPRYNKSRNIVDSSGCKLEGDSIKGRVEVRLVSDGWVPPPDASITLVYDIDVKVADGKITGTYHAHENKDVRSRTAANETKYRRTKEAGVKRGSVGAVLKMLPSLTIHQYEHMGDLTGRVERLTFKERMIAQPAFDGDKMYIRTYKSLICIGKKGGEGEKFVAETVGRTLMRMFPSKIYRVLTADAKARIDMEVTPETPVERIVTGLMPKEWIYVWPFRMREGADPLEPIGGCAKALPVAGTEFSSGGKKHQFKKVEKKDIRGEGIEVNAMRDGMGGSERYYYTVLDNRLGRKVLRIVLKGVATEGWIAGQRIKDGTIVRVEGAGMLPVLIKASFPAGLPPFRKRGKIMFFCEEVDDPSGKYREQIALLTKNEDALRKVIECMPGSFLATRAQYLLGFVEAAKNRGEKSD